VRQSLEVECLAGRVLLYRGATPGRNDLYDNRNYRSISYGTSLYAGCIHDIGASAFDYMSQEQNAATILALPAAELRKGVFYIPVEHTLLQIFGCGEEFHSRSKVWEMKNPETLIAGIFSKKARSGVRYWRALPDFLKSKLSKQAFFEEFYKAQQFLLTLKEAR
jgi:hypothetical protein